LVLKLKNKNLVKVKLIHRGSIASENTSFRHQTLDSAGIYSNCSFTFNPLNRDYDWLVVQDDVSKILDKQTEILACPKENTIFVTTEPDTIARYGKSFTNQFQYVITNQTEKTLPHPNAIRSHTGNVWFYGKTLNEILSTTKPTKSKKISTVCSNKQQGHTIHKKRFEFTKILEEEIVEIERFGKGYNWIDLKADAIDDYEFHVVIENQYAPNVWTEKLADCFLGYSVPIYYGCPNIYDYFPKDSIILIDIFDIEESIKKIKKIISTPGEYEKRLSSIIEARKKIIEEYNLLAMVDKIISENSVNKKTELSSVEKIYGRRKMRTKSLTDLLSFLGWKISNFFKNLRS